MINDGAINNNATINITNILGSRLSSTESSVTTLTQGNGFTNEGQNNIINWTLPNYNAGVSVSSGYSAPKNGWINIRQSTTGNNTTVNISGVGVSYQGSAGGMQVDRIYPISKGQQVTGSASYLVFYPCKGA